MLQNNLIIVNPAFDPSKTNYYKLLLSITKTAISYLIIDDKDSIQVIYDKQNCEKLNEDLKELFKTDIYLNLTYADTKVSLLEKNITTIPNELAIFEDENLPLFSISDSNIIHTLANKFYQFNCIYTLDNDLEKTIQENNLAINTIFHQYTQLLFLAQKINNNSLLINFSSKSITFVYTNENQLIAKNSFEIEDNNEFGYYLALILKQLQLSKENTSIYICGLIEKDDEKYQYLSHHFNQISFLLPEEKFLSDPVLDSFPLHYFTNLLTLNICG